MGATDDKAISKLLSYVLRHAPGSVGLALDDAGWTGLDELLAALRQHGHAVDEAAIRLVVAESDKRRFTLDGEGRRTRIRAAQGHSVTVALGHAASEPPDWLFHGTAVRNLDAILEEGLKPQTRQQVHLSPDVETATRVGQRHGKVVVLRVAAGRAHGDGIAFTQADNGVWLVDHLPSRYLSRETDPVT